MPARREVRKEHGISFDLPLGCRTCAQTRVSKSVNRLILCGKPWLTGSKNNGLPVQEAGPKRTNMTITHE
jgi:hypothetical protein